VVAEFGPVPGVVCAFTSRFTARERGIQAVIDPNKPLAIFSGEQTSGVHSRPAGACALQQIASAPDHRIACDGEGAKIYGGNVSQPYRQSPPSPSAPRLWWVVGAIGIRIAIDAAVAVYAITTARTIAADREAATPVRELVQTTGKSATGLAAGG
jgi:hypothetical protein